MPSTLAELRSDLILRADLPASEPRRYSNDQLNRLINQSIQRLQSNLETWWGEDYGLLAVDETVSAGVPSVIFGDYKIKTLFWRRPGRGNNLKLRQMRMGEMHHYLETDPRSWSAADPPRWWVQLAEGEPNLSRRAVVFSYPPTVDETVTIFFSYPFLDLVDDGDRFPHERGWEEWVLLDAMIRIRQRDKQEYADILNERQMMDERIRQQAPERAQTEIKTIRDVYPASLAGVGDYYWPRGDW